MIYKSRTRPQVLSIMDSLLVRANLNDEQKQYADYQIKGYEEEPMFDVIVGQNIPDKLVLNDLLLKTKGTTFQIDTLVITNQTLFVYEVKNYEGEFLFQNSRLTYFPSGIEILNPVNQVQRSTILLKQFLRKHNIEIDCEGFVVFVNPDCTIYQGNPDRHILFPSLLKSHFKKVYTKRQVTTEKTRDIAELLLNNHLESYPLLDLPDYDFDSLKKGIYCHQCNEFIASLTRRTCLCHRCGHKENALENAKRHLIEYQLLFPENPSNTIHLYKWCNEVHSMYRLREVIKEYKKGKSGTGQIII